VSWHRVHLGLGERVLVLEFQRRPDGILLRREGKESTVVPLIRSDGTIVVDAATRRVKGAAHVAKDRVWVALAGRTFEFRVVPATGRASGQEKTHAAGELRSPMTGKVLRLFVKEGERVAAGADVAIVEAMKMEHRIRTKAGGTVERVSVAEGAVVELGQPIATIAGDRAGEPSP
jgi:acetyl-CoA/propionyl-CoA carboxylase biotin carboxyl carrier protein